MRLTSKWNLLTTEQTEHALPDLSTLDTLTAVTLMNTRDKTVAEAVERALPEIAMAVDVIAAQMASGARWFYVGTGTSGRLGVLDAAELPPTFNTDPLLVQAIIAGGPDAVFHAQEGLEDQQDQGMQDLENAGAHAGDVVVGITASGQTPYVRGALQWARQSGLVTVAVSCNANPLVRQDAKITIVTGTGPEILGGSTRLKAATAEKMVLNMLSTMVMVRLGKTYRNLMVDMRPSNHKLRNRAIRIVMDAAQVNAEEAHVLLESAQGETKVAIAAKILQCSPQEARTQLQAAGGILARLAPRMQNDPMDASQSIGEKER